MFEILKDDFITRSVVVIFSESLEEAGGTEGDKQHGGTLPARYLIGYISFPASTASKEDTNQSFVTKILKIQSSVTKFLKIQSSVTKFLKIQSSITKILKKENMILKLIENLQVIFFFGFVDQILSSF